MAKGDIKLDGFAELDKALGKLSNSLERGVLRRVARKALEPMLDQAQQLAPVDDGDLRDSIVMASSSLTKRAKQQERKEPTRGVKVFVGTASRNGVPREFGTVRSAAQPFMRPAWDSTKGKALQTVKDELAGEIERTAARAAKRKAKKNG